jgi:hypothetical protein
MRCARKIVLASVLMAISAARPAFGGQSAVDPSAAFVAGFEMRAEHFDYHVENPSNFDPGPLVPHFYEQQYRVTAPWLFGRVRYHLGGAPAETSAGISAPMTTPGSDVDTFFQPTGEIITSGTRGNVRLDSWSIEERIGLARRRSWTLGVVLSYRRSKMTFFPADIVVTRGLPPTETRTPTDDPETTWSHVVRSGVSASVPLGSKKGWSVDLDTDATPLTRARLDISLPVKYPNQILKQDTFNFGVTGSLRAERQLGRTTLGVGINLAGVWGYGGTSARYGERALGVGIWIGHR